MKAGFSRHIVASHNMASSRSRVPRPFVVGIAMRELCVTSSNHACVAVQPDASGSGALYDTADGCRPAPTCA